jgi:hypothetical protein
VTASDESPRHGFASLSRHAAIYGCASGALGGAWMMAEYALGFGTERIDIGRYTQLASLVIPVAATVLGVMRWRDNACGGAFRFPQAFGAALGIGLAFSATMAAAAWFYSAVINPQIIPAILDAQAAGMAAAGATPEDVTRTREEALLRATPGALAYSVFVFSIIKSFVIALMAAVSVRKKPLDPGPTPA